MSKFDINDFCRFYNITEAEANTFIYEFFSAPNFKEAKKVFIRFVETHDPNPDVLPEYMERYYEEEFEEVEEDYD